VRADPGSAHQKAQNKKRDLSHAKALIQSGRILGLQV
jgi:hypothetical protein